MLLTCNGLHLVPLAGLEPAACCLGDVRVQTLCRSTKVLVARERGAKVIRWVLDHYPVGSEPGLRIPSTVRPGRVRSRIRPAPSTAIITRW